MDTATSNGRYVQPSYSTTGMTDPDFDYAERYHSPGGQVASAAPPARVTTPSFYIQDPSAAEIEYGAGDPSYERRTVQRRSVGPTSQQFEEDQQLPPNPSVFRRKPIASRPAMGERQASNSAIPQPSPSDSNGAYDTISLPFRQAHHRTGSEPLQTHPPVVTSQYEPLPRAPLLDDEFDEEPAEQPQEVEQLHYHHLWEEPGDKNTPKVSHGRFKSTDSELQSSASATSAHLDARDGQSNDARPYSIASGPALHNRGRSLTPHDIRSETSRSSGGHGRDRSTGRSPDGRPISQLDLLNIPYSQQMAQQNLSLGNAQLRGAVGANASLLETRKTLEMYRANIKKTNDPAVSYEFAIFMIQAAQAAATGNASDQGSSHPQESDGLSSEKEVAKLISEARQILQKLADRTYVFAQYYLADGYASGLFHKGKEDYERAFPLFVSASKHGHAESGFRAALCYEFGWGCRRDYAKAVQFYRHAAARGHPGAAGRLGNACLTGDMGLVGRDREGINWLKRATESADPQHNSAPYELGVLHTTGYGDDVFKDEGYAAQLFTKAAELGHAQASLRMGDAYEHGLLTCPKDPALSIHFYTGAAEAGLPEAMMALCAWYMVGAEPVLEKDEVEAYEWAKRAADCEYAKAEYAIGYFTEMGIGCRRDPLQANVWYVRAADQGDERAKQRLQIIRAAETGDFQTAATLKPPKGGMVKKKKSIGGGAEKELKDDKDCIVM